MKLFVDTANLDELEQCIMRGFPAGVTTNPAILSKEKQRDFRDHINDMIAILQKYDCKIPLSVEVFSTEAGEMLRQAEEFMTCFGHYPYVNVKIPVGWEELKVIAELHRRGIQVNCTCCMSYNQAIMAARAGADFVSLFWGRIRDVGYDAGSVVRAVANTLKESGSTSEIIVGSIRHIADINEAMQAGAHILTVPPKFFPQMCQHPKTDEAVQQFVTEFTKWQNQGVTVPLRKVA